MHLCAGKKKKKGDMCLKVIENGKHKDVHIKEGEVSFNYASTVLLKGAQKTN